MFALLSRYFEGVQPDQFERDLEEKNWVVEMRRGGRLVGFSTFLAREAFFEGRHLTAVYSGDTIVAPEAWGSPLLSRTWIAAVNAVRRQHPARPCYWLLLTSGFRTYRFLPVFWKTFHPRRNIPTPTHEQRLLDHLARGHYGNDYDPGTGIVRLAHPQRLRGLAGNPPEGRVSNPDVAFFLARNPGHSAGDELACLTEISDENLTSAGRRMVAAPQG